MSRLTTLLLVSIGVQLAYVSVDSLLPDGQCKVQTAYDRKLSEVEHEAIFDKTIQNFENSFLKAKSMRGKKECRPTEKSLAECRFIIQQWMHTIEVAVKPHLSEPDFDAMQKTVLFGDLMDPSIMQAFKGFGAQRVAGHSMLFASMQQ